jgi:amino acid adenylation domain-containing protein
LAYYEQGQQERSIAELSCLSEAEGQGLIHDWNQNHAPIHDNSHLLTQYEQQVAHRPDAIALRYRNEQGELQSLSYRELDQHANRLAHELIAKGIQNEAPVGLCVHRHSALLVGVLAILKAGGCYVPLDPNYPQARLSATIEQAQIHYVLTEASLLPEHSNLLPQAIDQRTVEYIDISKAEAFSQYPESRPEVSRHAKQLVYVIFTSGSTGKPKGVAIEHRSAQNFLQAMQDKLHLQAGHHWLAVTSLAFDISVLELFLPIQQGACVVLANYEDARDGQRLANLINGESISHMQATPISWKLLLAEPNALQAAKLTAVVGGEALPADLADALLPHVRCLWNCYGPTETTVWSSIYPVRPSSQRAISIGEPLLNNRLYVLDDQLKPVPLGVAGELYIGGDSLARSYWQRADLSAQQFIPDPYSTEDGARMYRTGDLVCRRHDGLLDYLGRSDQQVKVNGHRIELGDIEYHLKQWHEITDAAVQVQHFQQQQRLIAFVVANDLDTETLDETALRQALRQQLPEYMQPAQYVVLDALPLTANGKLNRKALPPVDLHQGEAKQAPTNEVEQFLLEQLQAVLSTDTGDDSLSIGIHDNFFALGGDSISAVQLVQRIKAQGWAISPRDVFVHQSIAELAEALQAQPKHFPLSPAQQQWLTFAPNATQTLYWYAIHAPRKYSAEQWQQAWQQLQQRHDSLRLRFVTMQGQDGQSSIQQSFDGNATFRHEERIEAEQLPTQSEVSAQLWFAKAHGRQRSHGRSGDQIYIGLNPLIADEASVQQLQSELLALVAEDALPASGPSFNDWLNTAATAIQHAWPQANSEHEQAPYHAPMSAGISLNDEQQQALSENKLNLLEAAQACWHYVSAQHHNDTQAPSTNFETYLERPGRHNDAFEENWQDCIGAFAYPQRLNSFSAQQVSAQQDWAHIIEQVKQSRQDKDLQRPTQSQSEATKPQPVLLRHGECCHGLGDRYAAMGFALKLHVWSEPQAIHWLWEAQQNCWSTATLQAYFDDFESAWRSLLEHLMSDQKQSLSAGDFPFAKQLNQDALAAVMAQLQGQSAPNNDPAANAASNAVKEKQA